MDEILEVAVSVDPLELVLDEGTELFFVDDGLELTIDAPTELLIQNDTVEILTVAELMPGNNPGTGVNIHFGSTPPLNPSLNDLWIKT